MESLVAKLEDQVTKAASKVVSQVNQIHTTLENELSTLIKLAAGKEEKAEAAFTELAAKIDKQLKELAEDSRLKLSDAAATGRYGIKQLVETSQTSIDEEKNSALKALNKSAKACREVSLKAIGEVETRLKDLIESRKESVSELITHVCDTLQEISRDQEAKILSRFDRLKTRMSDESKLIDSSFEQHLSSLNEDINAACERAAEKLNQSKHEFESALKQAISICELELSRIAKSLHGTVLSPALRERKIALKQRVVSLEKRFSEESESRNRKHAASMDFTVNEIKLDLQRAVAESVSSVDTTGKEEQQSLSDIFDKTNAYIDEASARATTRYQETEEKIAEYEDACRQLLDASAVETDPSLEEQRERIVDSLQELQRSKASNLLEVIEKHCRGLEETGQSHLEKLSQKREEHVAAVRETSQKALTSIRDAVQEAFEAIQMIREKHLE